MMWRLTDSHGGTRTEEGRGVGKAHWKERGTKGRTETEKEIEIGTVAETAKEKEKRDGDINLWGN